QRIRDKCERLWANSTHARQSVIKFAASLGIYKQDLQISCSELADRVMHIRENLRNTPIEPFTDMRARAEAGDFMGSGHVRPRPGGNYGVRIDLRNPPFERPLSRSVSPF